MICTRCSRDIDADSVFCRFCGAAVREVSPRRLTRLPAEGQIGGVCAGMAAYFNADVTLVRLAWVILSVVPGAIVGGLIAYAAAWLILPASVCFAQQPIERSGACAVGLPSISVSTPPWSGSRP
jgi:phage shock protein C